MNFSEINTIPAKMVLLRGPLLTQSGYGVHARQIAKWLLTRPDLNVEVQALPWGDTPWIIDDKWDSGFIGRIMQKTVDPSGKLYDVTVQIQLPNEWDPKLGKVNIGVTAGVETDRANPEWVEACNRMSMVIVPSKHTEASLKASGQIKTPIHVVPEAFSSAILEKAPTQFDSVDFSTSFNFLLFGQLTGNNPENDRKNMFYSVRWLCEVFKNDPNVGIVIKTNSGRNTNIDRKVVTQVLKGLLGEVRKTDFPKIHLVHGDMTDQEVSSLYRHPKIKALITATRGEGYGLPILEAAASGLPVIATGWSGHVDFLSHGKYIDLAYKLEPIHQSRIDGKIFIPGSKWANVIEEDFKKKVIRFRTAHTIPTEWAKDLSVKIMEKYSIDTVVKTYNDVTKDLV